MNAPLADALQDCLEAIEHGVTADAALARHPSLQSDLRPLLTAARLVRHHRPRPAASFRARVLGSLAEIDLTSAAWTRSAAPATVIATTDPQPAGPRVWWRPFATRLAGSALAVAVLLGGTVLASANTRPGDLLYPVRRGVEQLQETTSAALAPVAVGFRQWTSPQPAPTAAAVAATVAPSGDMRAGLGAGYRAEPYDGVGDTRRQVTRGDDVPDGDRGRGGDPADGGMDQGPASAQAEPPSPADPGSGAAGELGAAGQAATPPAESTDAPLAAPPTPAAPGPAAPSEEPSPADPGEPAERPSPQATQGASSLPPPPTGPPLAIRGAPTPEPVEIGAGPFATLRGAIARDDGSPGGAPLEGWLVSAYVVAGPRDEPSWWQRWSARTNESGRYQVGVPPGRYKVFASPNPHQWQQGRWYPGTGKFNEADVVTLVAGETRDGIDIRFDRLPPWLEPWRGLFRGQPSP